MKKLPDNQKSTTEEFSVTASVGKQYRTKHYNLDAIIAQENSVSSILEHTVEDGKNYSAKFYNLYASMPLFLLSTVYQQN